MVKFSFIVFLVLLTYAPNPTQLNERWALFLSVYYQKHSVAKLHFFPPKKISFTFTTLEVLGSWLIVTEGVTWGERVTSLKYKLRANPGFCNAGLSRNGRDSVFGTPACRDSLLATGDRRQDSTCARMPGVSGRRTWLLGKAGGGVLRR